MPLDLLSGSTCVRRPTRFEDSRFPSVWWRLSNGIQPKERGVRRWKGKVKWQEKGHIPESCQIDTRKYECGSHSHYQKKFQSFGPWAKITRCDSLVTICEQFCIVPLTWLVSTHWPVTVGRADCTWQVEVWLGARETSPSEVLMHENANAKSSLQSSFKIRLHALFSESGQRNFWVLHLYGKLLSVDYRRPSLKTEHQIRTLSLGTSTQNQAHSCAALLTMENHSDRRGSSFLWPRNTLSPHPNGVSPQPRPLLQTAAS